MKSIATKAPSHKEEMYVAAYCNVPIHSSCVSVFVAE